MIENQKREEFPTLTFGPVEKKGRIIFPQTLEKAKKLFLENGTLLIKNVFSSNYIQKLNDEYTDTYSKYLQDKKFDDALKVGDKRTMITVSLDGVFNDPEFYANPLIYPLLQYLLSPNMIVGSFGSVTSLPGAREQHIHRDLPHIFDQPDVYPGGEKVLPYLPPYAITVITPLVPVNELNGTTRMWLGSHLVTMEKTMDQPISDPIAEAGDVILFDYRLLHTGLANKSNEVRPILYSVYSRPWFRDYINYRKQESLIIPAEEYEKIPKKYLQLFSWSKHGNRHYTL